LLVPLLVRHVRLCYSVVYGSATLGLLLLLCQIRSRSESVSGRRPLEDARRAGPKTGSKAPEIRVG
jgi:hypothetical protein